MKENENVRGKVVAVWQFEGFTRREVQRAGAGDIVAISGLPNVDIGDTIADEGEPRALPRIKVEEPTLKMVFRVNNSPFAGREGKYVTSRNLATASRRKPSRTSRSGSSRPTTRRRSPSSAAASCSSRC